VARQLAQQGCWRRFVYSWKVPVLVREGNERNAHEHHHYQDEQQHMARMVAHVGCSATDLLWDLLTS
jgi:hypothetical protein